MSIFEYDETAHMSYVHEEGRMAGWEEGLIEGRAEGEWASKISLIQKKLDKKIDAVQIADMVEEDEQTVAELIALITETPDKSRDELAALYLKRKKH